MSHKLPFAAALVVLLLAAPARGQTPFVVNAQSTTGPPTQATVSGSSMIDLVENLIESQGLFANFQNQGFDASLNYGAMTDAIQFQRNAAGTSATVTIPSTGFSRTFTGGNESEVREQIEDFILREGAREYARFMKQVNQQSLLAVTDGNPQAATAVLSNSAFARFGLHRSPMDAGSLVGGTPYGGGMRLDLNGGVVDTDVAGPDADMYEQRGPALARQPVGSRPLDERRTVHVVGVGRGRLDDRIEERVKHRMLRI